MSRHEADPLQRDTEWPEHMYVKHPNGTPLRNENGYYHIPCPALCGEKFVGHEGMITLKRHLLAEKPNDRDDIKILHGLLLQMHYPRPCLVCGKVFSKWDNRDLFRHNTEAHPDLGDISTFEGFASQMRLFYVPSLPPNALFLPPYTVKRWMTWRQETSKYTYERLKWQVMNQPKLSSFKAFLRHNDPAMLDASLRRMCTCRFGFDEYFPAPPGIFLQPELMGYLVHAEEAGHPPEQQQSARAMLEEVQSLYYDGTI